MTSESSHNPVKIIGLACERSVDFDGKLDETGHLLDNPGVRIIKVPCSGQIQPIMLETALKSGASGAFALGCRMGDCHYREGNKFCRDRLLGKRMPKLKPSVDKRRVQGYWLSAVEYDKLREMVAEFVESCKQLPPPSSDVKSAAKTPVHQR
jgi:F420-non-reducing hydrogenase iron-sulfur subunit